MSTDRTAEIQPFASEAKRQEFYDQAFAQAQTMLSEAPDRPQSVWRTPDPIHYDANNTAGQMITWVHPPGRDISDARV